MPNIFDKIAKSAFDVVTTTFGYDATWEPILAIGTIYKARVGYWEPTSEYSFNAQGRGDVSSMIDSYNTPNYWMEYKLGDFPGLFESVQNGSDVNGDEIEKVIIFSVEYPLGRTFVIQKITALVDGKCFQAKLQLFA